MLKTAVAGGAVGLLGTGWAIMDSSADDFISKKALTRTVISATIAGVVFGAVLGALRPLHEEKKWSAREQERITTDLLQR